MANTQSVAAEEVEAKLIELTGFDINQDSLRFIITSLPVNGTLRDSQNGQINFTPRELFGDEVIYTSATTGNFVTDSFTFVVNDGKVDSESATIHINFRSPSVSAVEIIADGVKVTFTKAVDPNTVDETTFKVSDDGTPITAASIVVANDGLSASFTPSSSLEAGVEYRVELTDGITSATGNHPLIAFDAEAGF